MAAALARGKALGGDRGYRPSAGPDARAAALARRETAERTAYRILLDLEALQADGVRGNAALARAMMARGLPTPRGSPTWTHTTVARLLARADANNLNQ